MCRTLFSLLRLYSLSRHVRIWTATTHHRDGNIIIVRDRQRRRESQRNTMVEEEVQRLPVARFGEEISGNHV
jgi:hypothetical protein